MATATRVPRPTTVTSDTPSKKSSVSSGIRITIALVVALTLGLFMLTWDAKFIHHSPLPDWLGPFVFTPLIAVIIGILSNAIIQQLSCGEIQWVAQLQRVSMVPVIFLLLWTFLYFIPGFRWPIEGLFQNGSPELRLGLSSGFYAFWIGLYCQSLMNGFAQLCPN